jgi:serine phosphatase RsbU (regulator of sigma subunit)/methyl-accepting chemotaxis protein
LKLLHKLLLLVLTLSVIPLGIVGFQALSGLNSEIKDDIHTIFKVKVEASSTIVQRVMNSTSKKLLEAIHFRRVGHMNKKEMNTFVTDLLRQYDELMVISILDELGEEITSALVEDEVSPITLSNHLKNITPQNLEKMLTEKEQYSSVFFSNNTPMITLYSSFPFKDRPAPGRIAITISLATINKMITEIEFSKSISGVILLLDKDRKIISSKSKNLNKESLHEYTQNAYIKKAFINKKGIDSSTGEFNNKELTYMGAYKFIDKLNWFLLISEPKSDVFASADLLFDRTIGVILVTIIASVLGGLIMARRLIKPILSLVKGAKEIGSGNLDYKIAKTSSDEIGQLCDSFSDMGANLKHHDEIINKIRTIASELNSLFEKEAVAKLGISAIKDIINCTSIDIYLLENENLIALFEKSPQLDIPTKDKLQDLEKAFIEENQNTDDRLLVPLGKQDPQKGWIFKGGLVIKKASFEKIDSQVVEILAGAIAISFLNIEFLSDSVTNERRAHELELAELVQKTLFPENDPETPKMDFGSYLLSSSETGGDWYGYIESSDGKTISVLIGDVTGHGAPAALITAATNAFVRTVEHLSKTFNDGKNTFDFDLHDPIFLLKLLNKVVLETAQGRLVMTFFISTINMETGDMIYANAGHNAPWVLRKDPSRDSSVLGEQPKIKKVGGKIKIKIGKKKNTEEEIAVETEAAPKKKLKISMGKKSAVKQPSEEITVEATAETTNEPPSGEEVKPKKKLKIKLGSKKSSKDGKVKKVNRWENLNARGMRLGEVLDATFESRSIRLLKGDVMVWYTDGWIENTNESMEEYGKKRMQKVLQEHEDKEPEEMIEELRKSSWEFYDGFQREDDLTIVISKINADW